MGGVVVGDPSRAWRSGRANARGQPPGGQGQAGADAPVEFKEEAIHSGERASGMGRTAWICEEAADLGDQGVGTIGLGDPRVFGNVEVHAQHTLTFASGRSLA